MSLGDKMNEYNFDVLLNIPPGQAIQWMAFYDEQSDRQAKALEAAKNRPK